MNFADAGRIGSGLGFGQRLLFDTAKTRCARQ